MKTTPLPSVENLTKDWGMLKDLPNDLIDYDKYRVEDVQDLLTQDRDQAYTSLVEGIEGMTYAMNVDEYLELVEKWEGKNYDQPFDDGYAQALKDIRENVVKPLYNKTGDN